MSHPKRVHQHNGHQLPHLNDAVDPASGKADQKALAAGVDAWNKALADGEFELETVHEMAIPGDPTRDVMTIVRHKLTK